jgi:glutathione synthase/RimK-type ligase-like ATP-grasp enzyme
MIKTLIVIDNTVEDFSGYGADVISFAVYLKEYPIRNEPKTRIINLCDTEHYLSKGYYCSLLAEARDHIAFPTVKTINDLRFANIENDNALLYGDVLDHPDLYTSLQEHLIYFGKVEDSRLKKVATKIFSKHPTPLLKLSLSIEHGKPKISIERWSFSALTAHQRSIFLMHLSDFVQTVWRTGGIRKQHRWEMAILINPEEKMPPSNKDAISKFIKAAGKQGIHAQALTISQLYNISHYDALFIRETTGIDHHTYQIAVNAENTGLVVIDDPVSILRCCNKVYLHDAFSYQKVPSLKTQVVIDQSDLTIASLEKAFTYPMVLKMPEGSFSDGVHKVSNKSELISRLNQLFKKSALALAQEYLFTEYDWRIGVLNGRAIYACKYKMARNHWQIYNHNSKRFFSGDFETLPTFEVPKIVLDAALKAANVIGNGLYGVDIKEASGAAYVIEINDNPNIDHHVEDAYLGDELYMQIISEFCRRLELRGR